MMVSYIVLSEDVGGLLTFLGWATGIFLPDRAEDASRRRREMRDSGVSASHSHRRGGSSHGSHRRDPSSPDVDGEIKAFPLVCVCLPDHWQKTIENEVAPEYESSSSQRSQNLDDSHYGDPRAEAYPGRRLGEKSSSRFKDDLNVPRR